jgi:alpha-1,3-rhamnosyl/mannosyltransferase
VAADAALLVDPRDADAIAGALAQVLDDQSLALQLGAAGLVRAGELTWDRTAELTAAAYEEVAG